MQLLVNDNAIELLKSLGKEAKFRTAKDNTEFFVLLKQKLILDIDKMTGVGDAEKKLDSLIDTYLSLREFMTAMDTVLISSNRTMKGEIEKRKEKVGGFSKKIIIESITKIDPDDSKEVAEVRAYGEEHGFPQMVLGRNNEGQIYANMGTGGKDWWEQFITTRKTNDSFRRLLGAVRRNDIYEGQSESKIQSG